MGIRLARYVERRLTQRGASASLIDAQQLGLPLLDRMYKEYGPGEAPESMRALAERISGADGFVFVTGEYNHGVQPGLKNLVDHFLEEWFWRPAGIACYSAGGFGGVRGMTSWRVILAELGMPPISSVFAVPRIRQALDEAGEPLGEDTEAFERRFHRFADDLTWWAEAAQRQRAEKAPPF